jgi:cell division septation protein DedD
MSRTLIPEPELSAAPEPSKPDVQSEPPLPQEFEFVLGRRQVASVSLVVITLLALFTVAAYMVGKSSSKITAKTVTVEVPAPAKPVVAPPSPAPAVPAVAEVALAEAPLAGTPEKGKLYIQLGYVERGFATLMVYGSRRLGYPAFISPNGSETTYRVLSGPYADNAEYERAKTAFAAMGLDTFVRRYTEAAPATPTNTP